MPPEVPADGSGHSRREFLERTAFAAGIAGAAGLSADTILAQAAQASAQFRPLPKPRNVPIDHFVLLMMENRSYDHYFGWLKGYSDARQNQKYPDADGHLVATRHASTLGTNGVEWKGCGHPDPGHGWTSGRAQLNGGFLAPGSGNDEFALCYYNRGDLGFIHEAARNYTLYDRYFCSILASTWPNRYYKWSAQSGGLKNNGIAPGGNNWETIFDRALARGLTVKYYYSDLPFAALFGARSSTWIAPISQYYADAAAGSLPNVAIVDPAYGDGSGSDGLSADEHPLGDVRLGQAFQADVVNAFTHSPNYRRGALFLIYDEWGGFFDHVRPPRVPDDRASTEQNEDFGQLGFRVPAVAVSPYTRNRGVTQKGHLGGWWFKPVWRVEHGTYAHESILNFISYRFGLGFLNKRHKYANNIGHSFDFWGKTDFVPADLPDPPVILTRRCALGGQDVEDPEAGHAADLEKMANTAEKLKMPVLDGSPELIFQQPDTMKKAIAAAP
jgi:phospholipase C